MKTSILTTTAALMVLAMGCSTTGGRRCSAVVAHSPTEFDVCVASTEMNVGDRVAFYKKRCTAPSRGTPAKCSLNKIGEGSIAKFLDEHMSTVKLDSDFEINENTIIKKR